MSLRTRLALWTLRSSYHLEAVLPALLNRSSLLELNRAAFTAESPKWIAAADRGLDSAESLLVDKLMLRSGKVLCLASGGGREAFALARRGCSVVGVEQIPEMAEASAAHASKSGLNARFCAGDMTQLELKEVFDLIFILNIAYGCVPSRPARVALLSRCLRHLARAGRCAVSFVVRAPSAAERRWFSVGQALSRLAGNPGYELGDRVDAGPMYVRRFPDAETVAGEAREAGFSRVEVFSPEGFERFAILSR